MTKVSSTYRFHILGGFTAVVMALCSNDSINKLATIGLTGDPMAAPFVCSKKLALEQEIGIEQTEFQQLIDVVADMVVLLRSSVFCCSLFLMISTADVTGIDVSKRDTSKEVMHSPSSSLMFFI